MSKKTKTQSTQSSTATVTPNNPTWVTQGLESVGGGLQKLMGMDPRSFVAGPSALQTKAFNDAAGLTSSPFFGDAGKIFKDVAGAGANTYDADTYDASTGTATSWNADGYDPVTGKATNYDFIKAGTAQGYDPTSATASTYNASSLLDGLNNYMSPYTGQVVDAALADYDYGAGQTRANQALDEARSGAFGGSGAAITRAMTEGDLARGRAATSANLRDQAFTRGAGLSATDAGFRNDASRFNADALTRVSMSNADAANAAAAFRADANNRFALTDAASANEAARFNADAANRFGLANMDARNSAAAFGANARNTASAANADAANRFGLANMDARNAANAFNANARNSAGAFNASARDAALSRQLAAGGALADLGTSMGNDTRANIALQGTLGADQRAIEQALASAPLDVLERIAKTYGGLPLNLLSGSTTTGSGTSSGTTKTYDPWGTASNVLNAAGTAMMAFSDRRLKTDVEKIGEREDGLGVYAFRYLWSPVRYIGVMAQEVLKVKPEAVIHTPSGFMAVNYGAL